LLRRQRTAARNDGDDLFHFRNKHFKRIDCQSARRFGGEQAFSARKQDMQVLAFDFFCPGEIQLYVLS
jgi:hypothetical protein